MIVLELLKLLEMEIIDLLLVLQSSPYPINESLGSHNSLLTVRYEWQESIIHI